jgi:phosphopantetheinyl transferase
MHGLVTSLRIIRPISPDLGKGREAEREAVRRLIGEVAPGCELSHLPNGAPCIEGYPYTISLSHTKGFIAFVAHSKPYPAGIDIEYRSERALRVRERFLSLKENAAIDESHAAEHVLLHWCAKETLYKLLNTSGVDFRRELHILPFPFGMSGTIQANAAARGLFLLDFEINPEYVCVWNRGRG